MDYLLRGGTLAVASGHSDVLIRNLLLFLGLVSHLPTGMSIAAAADCNDLILVAVSVQAAMCESCLV
jgi:hypothetical protein